MNIKKIIYKWLVPTWYKDFRISRDSSWYTIIQCPEAIFPHIYRIKDDTWEHVCMPEIYKLMKSWDNISYHPHQDILILPSCIVRANTDIVTIGSDCIWEKANDELFSHKIPHDEGLISFNNEKLQLRNSNLTVKISGDCMSLIGENDNIWAHFLIQYLPRLYYAEEAGIFDKNSITLLMPKYDDPNIQELIAEFLQKHHSIIPVYYTNKNRTAYICERLYYTPTPSIANNDSYYILPYDFVIPRRVTDLLYQKVVAPRLDNSKETKRDRLKLYLVRRSTTRGLRNYQEIENYFVQKGFLLIEPHTLTLQQKADLFSNAEIIAGPSSSAWTNVMFCRGAKGLYFSNFSKTIEAYVKYLMQLGRMNVLCVTGWNYTTNSIHSDYSVPLERIDAAYKQLTGVKE